MTLSKITRIALAIGSLALAVTFFVPLWQIMLWAPQYPEGLVMKIWHNNLSGNVDIINGLNHYIGMKHISVDMFPEFGYIGILIAILMAVGLAAALFSSGRILFLFTLLSYVYGVAALWDFWRWGYDYGHHLDPNAAIKVQDMAYQPPLIGYKNLLNFTAFSGPDIGAWVIIVVCLMATALWWYEFFRSRKLSVATGNLAQKAKIAATVTAVLFFYSCSSGPEPIRYGQDQCNHCKMTLTDKRYGAEVVTAKGKVFKFDDLNCLCAFLEEGKLPETEIAQVVSVDFKKTGVFVDVKKAKFLQHESLKSPMRGDIATFTDENDLQAVRSELGGGTAMDWPAVKNGFKH